MAYLTDRKRATGLGAAKTGTGAFWNQTISAVALAILVPLFIITFAPMLGQSHADVVAHFARPYPAIVTGLTLVVGMVHFRHGVQVAIEDYSDGLTRKALIIGATLIAYTIAAMGLFAIARIAL